MNTPYKSAEFTDPLEFFDTQYDNEGNPVESDGASENNVNPDKHNNSEKL